MKCTVGAIVILWFAALTTANAQATILHAGTSAGLMQQPTSNYYHAVYGGFLQTSTDNEGLIFRASYSERPEFSANGYADKETFTVGSIGSKFSRTQKHGLYAFMGAGETYGYIRREEASIDASNFRSFRMTGFTTAMEYLANVGPVTVSLNHTLFVGYGGSEEFESNVAWPYNLTQLQIGAHW